MVDYINSLEPSISILTDSELRLKTDEFKKRLEKREELDSILPEAFAVVREVARRVLDMRHFDVQLIGGIVLHEGKIAEMATGEGKTLVATLPAYLNALLARGVHIVTVNDYLAKRDTQWMGPIYHALGLSVGVIQHDASFLFDPAYPSKDDRLKNLRPCSRQEAYRADITYGTNNEFGFDYLRDNMKFSAADFAQRELYYAIVDEVDSILIDEARTPLIISGPAEESTDLYYQIDRIIPRLTRDRDYQIDEKAKTASLTEDGIAKVERMLGVRNLYDPSHMDFLHHIHQALKAHTLFKRDVDYMVKDGQVIIVDEFTGRLMPGRRWSDGLHQAVEAKEKVKIERENQTLASITFQNYFRMYKKLAGMTGTADTEAAEFAKIYNLDVVVIPPNKPLLRTDYPDVVYKTKREKFQAAVEEIAELYKIGRPVLVGTTSIENSEALSRLLKQRGIPHQVLNAKYHEREAEIVAQAGRYKGVTIATNMAGRGTDILLGGNPKFLADELMRREEVDKEKLDHWEFEKTLEEVKRMQLYGLLDSRNSEDYAAAMAKARKITEAEHKKVVELGGLHILGTERHEARRVDNQLRGRAGRQGDPGSSRFYLSLEDDLLRIFGSDRLSKIMDKLGIQEGEPIEHSMVTKAIETAQKRVEAHNFEIRKHLLEYDDVMNKQRQIIYSERRRILEGENLKEHLEEMIDDVLEGLLDIYTHEEAYPEDWDLQGLSEAVERQFGLRVSWKPEEAPSLTRTLLKDELLEKVKAAYEERERSLTTEIMRYLERMIMLQVVDSQWKDHLYNIDHLKEGIGLRGYGQKDPLIEYKKEGFEMFEEMVERIKRETVQYLFKVQVSRPEEGVEEGEKALMAVGTRGPSFGGKERPGRSKAPVQPSAQAVPGPRAARKIGRNEPCPCGSGKKYKKCCGA